MGNIEGRLFVYPLSINTDLSNSVSILSVLLTGGTVKIADNSPAAFAFDTASTSFAGGRGGQVT